MDAWVSAFYYGMSDHGVCVRLCLQNKNEQVLPTAQSKKRCRHSLRFGVQLQPLAQRGISTEAVAPAPGQTVMICSCRRIKEFRHAGERHATLTFGLI